MKDTREPSEIEDTGREGRGARKLMPLWITLFVVCVLTAAACVGYFAYHAILRRSMADLYKEARVVYTVKTDGGSSASEDGEDVGLPSVSEDGDETVVSINFELLRETSPDVYAWIEIPGTEIAYPIVCHPTDNDYYLRRAINGSYDVTGCIYTQNYNSLDFSDPNTVIYGHYMSDGTKFGSLLKYSDKEYFDKYRRIVIYTESAMLEYEIFAAVPFNTKHILTNYNYTSDKRSAFLDEVFEVSDSRANFALSGADEVITSGGDRIITLSTCLKSSSKRFLVLAKLVKSTEAASSVSE